MSVEGEKKKPRKAPAKKAAATPEDVTAEKKVKAAAPKPSVPKKKAVNETSITESAAVPARAKTSPTHAQIAERAHGYFVDRGRQHGHHEQDWQRAERELRSEH
jgi:hypothetical protein